MTFENRWKNEIAPYSKPDKEYIKTAMSQIEDVVKQYCDIADFDFSRIKVNIPALEDVIIRTDMRIYILLFFIKK